MVKRTEFRIAAPAMIAPTSRCGDLLSLARCRASHRGWLLPVRLSPAGDARVRRGRAVEADQSGHDRRLTAAT
jgi:hypothetical protein